jgi:hypothetical protein
MTAMASSIEADPIAASRNRSSPGSTPATAVRSSTHPAPRTAAVSPEPAAAASGLT